MSRARFVAACLIAGVVGLLSTFAAVQPAEADWSPPTFISTEKQFDAQTQWLGDIAEGPDGSLHAAWGYYDHTATWPGEARYGLRYSQSTDGGVTWSQAVTITWTSFVYSAFWSPRLAVSDSGRIHLTYYYLNLYGYSAVNHAWSDDQGQTWTGNTLQGGCFPWFPTPAVDGDGNVYAAWERWKCNRSTLPNTVFFSRSLDQGSTWEPPAAVAEGGVMPGWILNADNANNLHLIFESPAPYYSPGYGQPYYARSQDRGVSWGITPVGPAGFVATGIFSSPGALLVPGYLSDGTDVFLRSTDAGSTWGNPLPITGLPSSPSTIGQIAVDAQGKYHTWKDQSYVTSSDGGQTWSDPDYMGNGSFGKMLVTSTGKILALGQFACLSTDTCAGVVEYREPFGVDAPAFESYWEKASFRYPFSVRGTGVVMASFPAEAVEIAGNEAVLAGGTGVPASVTTEGDRVIVSFPVSSEEWVNCSVPIYVKKGAVEKRSAIKAEIARLEGAFLEAAEAGDGELAVKIEASRNTLQAELLSSAQDFIVSISSEGVVKATDKTQVSIYEHVTAVYVHLKAATDINGGSELILKTADSITVSTGEPFMMEVKVTNLRNGGTALVGSTGSFSTLDRMETNATGTHKTTFYLFYPPSTTVQSEVVSFHVEIDGVVTSVPITVKVL